MGIVGAKKSLKKNVMGLLNFLKNSLELGYDTIYIIIKLFIIYFKHDMT